LLVVGFARCQFEPACRQTGGEERTVSRTCEGLSIARCQFERSRERGKPSQVFRQAQHDHTSSVCTFVCKNAKGEISLV